MRVVVLALLSNNGPLMPTNHQQPPSATQDFQAVRAVQFISLRGTGAFDKSTLAVLRTMIDRQPGIADIPTSVSGAS